MQFPNGNGTTKIKYTAGIDEQENRNNEQKEKGIDASIYKVHRDMEAKDSDIPCFRPAVPIHQYKKELEKFLINKEGLPD